MTDIASPPELSAAEFFDAAENGEAVLPDDVVWVPHDGGGNLHIRPFDDQHVWAVDIARHSAADCLAALAHFLMTAWVPEGAYIHDDKPCAEKPPPGAIFDGRGKVEFLSTWGRWFIARVEVACWSTFPESPWDTCPVCEDRRAP